MSDVTSPVFWLALSQIILINIVLSGDNAVVIALASRSLPPHQQKKAILFGSVGAIVLRLVLTFFAVYLLTLPYLKLIGAALLLWIGIGLLKGDDDGEDIEGNSSLMAAVKTIVVADLVMSLDNVIGVAAAAKGDVALLVIGLVISIPLIIFGSTIILKLMTRFPVIITLGAALLGWVAGEMCLSDPAIHHWVEQQPHVLHYIVPAAGALLVVALGKWLASRSAAEGAEAKAAGAEKPAH
ncbi:TerC family protein [Ramlibacter sp. XY19]|uniref:TerC family protein n=1 Tax=Ramlibacter paludis TaxID=2908000 RepID=UPI0023D9FD8D|nr:TerC family protein [Ramlibacter paludis]MCG2592189.1 TerC family protein [Ramlibacter paludis]